MCGPSVTNKIINILMNFTTVNALFFCPEFAHDLHMCPGIYK